jgi:hypothetical protein
MGDGNDAQASELASSVHVKEECAGEQVPVKSDDKEGISAAAKDEPASASHVIVESSGAAAKPGGHAKAPDHEGAGKRPLPEQENGKEGPPKRARVEDTTGYRKVVLSGLQGMTNDILQSALERMAIPFWRLWKRKENDYAEVWLPDEKPIVAGCCRMLDAQALKGKVMVIDYAQGNEDVRPADSGDPSSETLRSLTRQVAPLHDMTYEDQLACKASLLRGSLRKVTLAMISETSAKKGFKGGVPMFVRVAKRGPIVPLSHLHPSPTVFGYRNKNEFTIGFDRDKQPQVGFRYGRFQEGRSGVGCADGCPNIPEEALAVARCVKDFILNHQTLECWGPEKHTGVWRQLTIRHSSTGDLLAVIQYSTNNCALADLDAAMAKLKDFLLEQVKQGKMRLTSLFGQEHNNVSNKAADDCPMALLWGEDCFYETLLGLKFRISPAAFFQVNSKAAEVLNQLIREWACASEDQVVLDVCCGTGTIGMCIASRE